MFRFASAPQDEAVKQIDALYDSQKSAIIAFANANLLNVAAVDAEFSHVLEEVPGDE